MDNIQEWEIVELINTVQFSDAQQWEMTRLLLSCYVDKKKVKNITDIIQFPWDINYIEQEHNQEITNDDIDKMKTKVKEISKYMQ
jgi:hypothetical protein